MEEVQTITQSTFVQDIIKNSRCTKKAFSAIKVKKHVAQITKMEKVTPRSITYIAWQVVMIVFVVINHK